MCRTRLAWGVFSGWIVVFLGLSHFTFALDPKIPLKDFRYDVWTSEKGLPSSTAQSILQTHDGYLWFGTPGGLARFDGIHFTVFDKEALSAPNADVLFLMEDRNNAMWIGTNGGGVVRYHNGVFKNFTTKDGLSNNFIWYIFEDKNGTLWFSTEKGINSYRNGKFQSYSLKKIQDDFVWSIFRDSKANLWFASDGSGLLRLQGTQETVFTKTDGLLSNVIYCLTEDDQGSLWIGTAYGLTNYKDGKFRTFTTADGLSSDVVYSLLIDHDGILWIGTGGGRINRYVNGQFETFAKDEGPVGNSIWSLYEDREGNVWSGPISYGINRFADDRVSAKNNTVPVIIEKLLIDDKKINPDTNVELQHGHIDIHYSALSYIAPEKIKFRYKLEGYDKDWIESKERQVSYKHLPAGNYDFHILAANHFGVWNLTSTSIRFTLIQPFTRTRWFYGLCVLSGLLLLTLLYYVRIRSLRYKEKALRVLVEKNTSELRKETIDREKAEEILDQYRILVETSNHIIWSINSEGFFIFVNKACVAVLGYNESEIIGRHFTDFQSRDQAQHDVQMLTEVLSGKIVDSFETELIHKNGSPVSLLCNAVAIRDENKKIIGVSGMASDITSRKESEKEIKKSEEKYRTLFEESKDVVFIVSKEGKFLDLNQTGLDLLGCSSKAEVAQLDLERDLHWDPEDRKIYRRIIQEQGFIKDYPIVLQALNGQKLILLVTATPQLDSSGNIFEVRGIGKDITSQKRTERFSTTLHQVTRLLSESGSLNDAALEILESICRGLEFEVGMFWVSSDYLDRLHCSTFWLSDYIDPKEFASARQRIILDGGRDLPFAVFSSGDSKCVTDFSSLETANAKFAHNLGLRCGIAFPVEGANSVYGVLEFYSKQKIDDDHQLTVLASSLGNQIGQFIQRRRAQEALRDSEKRYRSFVEDDLRGVYIASVDGKLLTCNPAFLRIFGFQSVQEALDCDWVCTYPNLHQWNEFVDKIRSNGKLEYHEHELRNKKGEPLYVLENAIGIFDENGNLLNIKGYIVDTTDRKRLEQQLMQVQKMEAIGSLAGGVAHDFNNILMAITSYAELLLIRMHGSDPLRPQVFEIRRAAEQGANLTRQLLAFSRRQILSPKHINLNEAIIGMEDMLRRLIGEDVHLEIVKGEDLGTVLADPGQIQQILMNLAVNSRDAMRTGGTLRMETSNKDVDEKMSHDYPGLAMGKFVALHVTDSGHGMDENTLKRIFEPFFTTKGEGKGTGLGLATVFGIVKQSGGSIYAQSQIEKGTTFSIYLPRVDDAPKQDKPTKSVQKNKLGQGEVLLLVDDNEMVRSATGTVLEMNGYQVLYADSGMSAISILKENSENIRLIVSDVVMPGMSGVELAEAVREFRPELRMLFMSGYTDEQSQLQKILESGCEFIAKPVTMNVLLHQISKLLSASLR